MKLLINDENCLQSLSTNRMIWYLQLNGWNHVRDDEDSASIWTKQNNHHSKTLRIPMPNHPNYLELIYRTLEGLADFENQSQLDILLDIKHLNADLFIFSFSGYNFSLKDSIQILSSIRNLLKCVTFIKQNSENNCSSEIAPTILNCVNQIQMEFSTAFISSEFSSTSFICISQILHSQVAEQLDQNLPQRQEENIIRQFNRKFASYFTSLKKLSSIESQENPFNPGDMKNINFVHKLIKLYQLIQERDFYFEERWSPFMPILDIDEGRKRKVIIDAKLINTAHKLVDKNMK